MNNSAQKKTSKILKVVLILLVMIVLALVVTISVFKINEGKGDDDETGLTFSVDDPIDDVSLLALRWEAIDAESVEEGKALYEEVINKHKDSIEDTLDLRIQYSTYLLDNGLNEESLAQLDLIDQSRLDVKQTIKLFMAYRDYYSFIDEEEKSEEYSAKIDELIKENNIDINNTEF